MLSSTPASPPKNATPGAWRKSTPSSSGTLKTDPPDRQPRAFPATGSARGKSGLRRAACRLTAGGIRSKRILRTSATENIPPCLATDEVRVKWCGKSAPQPEQFGWQGKPHVEQDQIGEEERPAPISTPG